MTTVERGIGFNWLHSEIYCVMLFRLFAANPSSTQNNRRERIKIKKKMSHSWAGISNFWQSYRRFQDAIRNVQQKTQNVSRNSKKEKKKERKDLDLNWIASHLLYCWRRADQHLRCTPEGDHLHLSANPGWEIHLRVPCRAVPQHLELQLFPSLLWCSNTRPCTEK